MMIEKEEKCLLKLLKGFHLKQGLLSQPEFVSNVRHFTVI
jgi:hypothetical protein